jgi:predicted cupin superfamily sugar epimerase
MDIQELISQLSLQEHIEGGYFRETYRSRETINTTRPGEKRAVMTSIYYLLTSERPLDHLHKNRSDIVHYFQLGSPITYITVSPDGQLQKVKLGSNFAQGEVMQLLVPAMYWKAAILEVGEFGLIGEAVAPGFDYQDMELATPAVIQAEFPELWPELAAYVRS